MRIRTRFVHDTVWGFENNIQQEIEVFEEKIT